MKRTVAFVAAVVLAATAGTVAMAGGQSKGSGGASKTTTKTTNYPVQVVFLDRDSDKITSDSKGPYKNGVDGVSAVMEVVDTTTNGQTTYGKGKLVFSISAFKGKLVRTLNVAYDAPVTPLGCGSSPSADQPTGTAQINFFQVLSGIATMPAGTRVGGGGFWEPMSLDPAGVFRFYDALVNYPDNCSTRYVITRDVTLKTWTVTTDFNSEATYFDQDGIAVAAGDVGDTSQFENVNGSLFYGNYKMPFSMTISCMGACSPVR